MRGTQLIALSLAAIIGATLIDAPTIARADDGDGTGVDDDDGAIVVAPIDVHGRRQQADGPDALVTDDPAHADAARATDDPAFATVVHIDDHAGETTSIAEALARTAGVHVRSLGGLGGYSSISVRGHASGHTAVFVNGVPLSRVASVSADLGRFDLASFSSLELYRGGVPVSLGGAALGGALVLHTAVGPAPDAVRVSMGAGSFGARHLRARWLGGRADGSIGYHLSAGYTGAAGDFVYFDDNGTNLNPSDDEMVRRSNNGYDRVDAVARVRRVRRRADHRCRHPHAGRAAGRARQRQRAVDRRVAGDVRPVGRRHPPQAPPPGSRRHQRRAGRLGVVRAPALPRSGQ